jgi:spore germination protein KC
MKVKKKNNIIVDADTIMKQMLTRIILLIILSFISFCLLFGCYDRREVDEMAYVMGIGLDKGKTPNSLMMTLQIAVPKAIGSGGGGDGGGGGGGGGQNQSTTITTLETPSIFSGINMVNNYESKQISLSHTQVVVFSEELARDGVEKYLHSLIRGREFRGSVFIVVTKGTAAEYLKNVKPLLEINPSKFYRMEYKAHRYTGFTADTTLLNFYLKSECYCSQAVATLAAVGRFKDTEDINIEGSTYKQKGTDYPLGGDYTAGNIPRSGENKAEIMGLAVFDGGKMVGELDGAETTYYLMVTGEYGYSYITVPDPLDENSFVLLDVKKRRNPIRKVNMVDGKPQIDVQIDLEADILSIQSGINYEDPKNNKVLEKSVEDFMGERMLLFLKKTSEEYGTDICSFGEKIRTKFITWDDWANFKWLDRYKDSKFSVKVTFKIRRPGLIIRSVPVTSTERSGG